MKEKAKKLKESKPKNSKNKKKSVSKTKVPSTKTTKKNSVTKKKNFKKTSKQLSVENNEVSFFNENTTQHEYNRPNDEVLLISKSEVDDQQNPMDKEFNVYEDIPAVDDNLNKVNSILTNIVQNNEKMNKNQDSTFEKMNINENIPIEDDNRKQSNNMLTNGIQNDEKMDKKQNFTIEKTNNNENILVDDQKNNNLTNTVQENEKIFEKQNHTDDEINVDNSIPDSYQKNNKLKSTDYAINITDEFNKHTNSPDSSLNRRKSISENETVTNESKKITKQQLENNDLVKNLSDNKSLDKISVNRKRSMSKNNKTENGITSTFDDARKNPVTHTKCDERKAKDRFKRRTLDTESFLNRWSSFKHLSKFCNKNCEAAKKKVNTSNKNTANGTKNKILTGHVERHNNPGIIYEIWKLNSSNDFDVQNKTILPLYECSDSTILYSGYENDVRLSKLCENSNPVITGPPTEKETKLLVKDLDNWVHNFDKKCMCQNQRNMLCNIEDEFDNATHSRFNNQ